MQEPQHPLHGSNLLDYYNWKTSEILQNSDIIIPPLQLNRTRGIILYLERSYVELSHKTFLLSWKSCWLIAWDFYILTSSPTYFRRRSLE